ncbi:MAG: hypothetical protein RBS39_07970 [Phycisphaerales bacterium]|jgi:hypothetical protein|nr:hypothetical protein [Phycisphaerales bacterium]
MNGSAARRLCALALGAIAGTASAEVVTYEFSGLVTERFGVHPSLTDVPLGAEIVLRATLDPDATPTFQQPGRIVWGSAPFVAMDAVVDGVPYPLYAPGDADPEGFMILRDNAGPGEGGELADEFDFSIASSPLGWARVLLYDDVDAEDVPQGSDAFSGLAFPDAAEIQPGRWSIAVVQVGGLSADVLSARIVPAPSAMLVFPCASIALLRRRS